MEPLECRQLLSADVTPVYAVTNSWNTGFEAAIRLENHEAAALDDWQLEFDMLADITSIWNAKIVSHTGNHYTIVGAPWDDSIPAGGSISFGFVASAASPPVTPTNYIVDGGPVGDPTPVLPGLSISDVTSNEGDSGLTDAVFVVSLSNAASSVVTVSYATVAGTATPGDDFDSVGGTLTFAAGQTTQAITVAVRGDTQVEADETFNLDLSAAAGATIARARATGTITNDDVPPAPAGDFQFAVGSDWGSGFTAEVTLRNSGATAIEDWQLEFDFVGDITTIWNAEIVSHSGNHFVVKNAGWNSAIAAGATTGFGFNGSPGNLAVEPTNYVLRSGSGGGGGGGTEPENSPPLAVDDFAFTGVGQAVVIYVLQNDSDPDGDALTVSEVAQPTNGAVVLNADSTLRYTPGAGFSGSDTFGYTLRDAEGATTTGQVSVTVTAAEQGEWPAQVFAPYIDMTLYPTYDFLATAQTEGLRYFTLAFVVADSGNEPAWGGFTEYGLGTDFDTQLRTQIAGLRTLGGDVAVSFGGAANRELAEVIPDVALLQGAYQSVIDAYGLTHIDFDIEGAATADRESVDRRNRAIAGLQRDAAAAGRTLEVSYTLPVLPTGLTADGLYVIDSAIRHGVDVGLVNIMAMDYGDSAAPNPDGRMGDYAIAAAGSLFDQLQTVYGASKTDAQLWQMVGVTPMIGLNDVTTETFDQQEARELLAFAQQMGIGRISMWSLNRDQQNSNGELGYVDLKSSSILQDPFEFSLIFNTFTG